MSNIQTTPMVRHPLGLPARRVRSILALMIPSMFCLLAPLPDEKQTPIPLNHSFLLALVMLVFVSRRPHSDADDHLKPFGLSIILFRAVILFGTAAILVWQYL